VYYELGSIISESVSVFLSTFMVSPTLTFSSPFLNLVRHPCITLQRQGLTDMDDTLLLPSTLCEHVLYVQNEYYCAKVSEINALNCSRVVSETHL
jgi:hypothetical protein